MIGVPHYYQDFLCVSGLEHAPNGGRIKSFVHPAYCYV